MAIPKRIRIYSNGDPVDGTKIVDADTGEETDYIKEIVIHMLSHEIKAEVWYDTASRHGCKIHYLNGDVELGDWDKYQQKQKANTDRKGDCIIIDDPHPDAKPVCSECGGLEYVDLATSRQPCQKCSKKAEKEKKLFEAYGGSVAVQSRLHKNDLAGEILLNPEWKSLRIEPEKRVGVLGPRTPELSGTIEVTFQNDELFEHYSKEQIRRALECRPDDRYFVNWVEARLAARLELGQQEELQGIKDSEIGKVVESWKDYLMLCEDAEQFMNDCCDMAGEILENVEKDGKITPDCKKFPYLDSLKAGVALESAAAGESFKVALDSLKEGEGRESETVENSWDDQGGDPVADLEEATAMIEKDIGYTADYDSLRHSFIGEAMRKVVEDEAEKIWKATGMKPNQIIGFRKNPLPTYVLEKVAQLAAGLKPICVIGPAVAAAITPQNIGGVCKVCQRPTPMGVQCCDVCKCERERQVRDLAQSQIKSKTVKAGDTVGITFAPDGEVVVFDIKSYTGGATLYCQLRREKKESIDKALVEIVEDANTKEECDECFGTGFQSGFGAPCSKGCKP